MGGVRNPEILLFLKKKQENASISQAEIARRLGIKPPVLSRQMNGKDAMSYVRVMNIADILELSEEDFTYLQNLIETDIEYQKKENEKEFLKKDYLDMISGHFEDPFLLNLINFWQHLPIEDKRDIFKIVADRFAAAVENEEKKDLQ